MGGLIGTPSGLADTSAWHDRADRQKRGLMSITPELGRSSGGGRRLRTVADGRRRHRQRNHASGETATMAITTTTIAELAGAFLGGTAVLLFFFDKVLKQGTGGRDHQE